MRDAMKKTRGRFFDPDAPHPQAPATVQRSFVDDVAFALGLGDSFSFEGGSWWTCRECNERRPKAPASPVGRWWLCSKRCADTPVNRELVRVFWYRRFIAPSFTVPSWIGRHPLGRPDEGACLQFDALFLKSIGVTRGDDDEPCRCSRCGAGWWGDEMPEGTGRHWWRCPNGCSRGDAMRLAAVARRAVGFTRTGPTVPGEPYEWQGWKSPDVKAWTRRAVRDVFDQIPAEWQRPQRKFAPLPAASLARLEARAAAALKRRAEYEASWPVELERRRYLRDVRELVSDHLEVEAAVTARVRLCRGSNWTHACCKKCSRRWYPWGTDEGSLARPRGEAPWWLCLDGCNKRLAGRVAALARTDKEREFLTGVAAAKPKRSRRAA